MRYSSKNSSSDFSKSQQQIIEEYQWKIIWKLLKNYSISLLSEQIVTIVLWNDSIWAGFKCSFPPSTILHIQCVTSTPYEGTIYSTAWLLTKCNLTIKVQSRPSRKGYSPHWFLQKIFMKRENSFEISFINFIRCQTTFFSIS